MDRLAGYRVKEEVPIKGGSVDLVASDGKELIAIEIETGKSDAIRNIRKDLKAGFDRVVVGVLDLKLKEKIEGLLGPEEARKVDFLSPARS